MLCKPVWFGNKIPPAVTLADTKSNNERTNVEHGNPPREHTVIELLIGEEK